MASDTLEASVNIIEHLHRGRALKSPVGRIQAQPEQAPVEDRNGIAQDLDVPRPPVLARPFAFPAYGPKVPAGRRKPVDTGATIAHPEYGILHQSQRLNLEKWLDQAVSTPHFPCSASLTGKG